MKPENKPWPLLILCFLVVCGALVFNLTTGSTIPGAQTGIPGQEEEDKGALAETRDRLPEEELHIIPHEVEDKLSGDPGYPEEGESSEQAQDAGPTPPDRHPDPLPSREMDRPPGAAKDENPPPAAAPSVGSAPPVPARPEISPFDTDLNDYVQEVIGTYQGYYPYLLNNDYANYNGVTENLYFNNRLLARAHPSGNRASHCVGITFEVFFKAMRERNRKLELPADHFNGMTFDELYDLLLIWYVASGSKLTNNIEIAVEKYGIGRGISRKEDARAGDFMDISRRNGTGHTVIFQNWIRDAGGRITGVRYWSTQSSGIGYNTEYFDTSGRGNVYFNLVYIARVLPVHQYRSFK